MFEKWLVLLNVRRNDTDFYNKHLINNLKSNYSGFMY